jgi:hypothetical protein
VLGAGAGIVVIRALYPDGSPAAAVDVVVPHPEPVEVPA